MAKLQAGRVEELPLETERVGSAGAVKRIADERMAGRLQMDADLVRHTSFDFHFDEAQALSKGAAPEPGGGAPAFRAPFSPFAFGERRHLFPVARIVRQRNVDHSVRFGLSPYQRPICFLDQPAPR